MKFEASYAQNTDYADQWIKRQLKPSELLSPATIWNPLIPVFPEFSGDWFYYPHQNNVITDSITRATRATRSTHYNLFKYINVSL
jgi:hypothetical protein